MFKLHLGLILFLISSCSTKSYKLPPCVDRRSVIEMGTNRTKLTIADVDSCHSKFFQTVARKDWIIDQDFSNETEKLSIDAISEALQTIDKYPQTKSPLIIATGIFREAKNLRPFFEKIKKIAGSMPIVLTPKEESKLGVKSLQVTEPELPQNYIVWDIGGNSMHLTLKKKKKTTYYYAEGSQFYKDLAKKILHGTSSY